jgi:hypothetical protein
MLQSRPSQDLSRVVQLNQSLQDALQARLVLTIVLTGLLRSASPRRRETNIPH